MSQSTFLALFFLTLLPGTISGAEPYRAQMRVQQPAWLRTAQQSKARVERAEAELDRSLTDLYETVENAVAALGKNPHDFGRVVDTLESLHLPVRTLRDHGQEIINSHKTFLAAAEKYGNELSAVPATFEAAAQQFRTYAADEEFSDLKERYLLIAATFDSVAARSIERRHLLEPQVRLVKENLTYVERGVVFLTRLDEALTGLPALESGRMAEKFLEDLKKYVDAFGKLQEILQHVHDALKNVEPMNPTKSKPKPKPSETAPAVRPAGNPERTAELARLRRIEAKLVSLRSPGVYDVLAQRGALVDTPAGLAAFYRYLCETHDEISGDPTFVAQVHWRACLLARGSG